MLEMSGSSESRNGSRLGPATIERDIVLVCHQISEEAARGDFNPNNLLEGRIDVLCRCISAALYVSNGIRGNTRIWLSLGASGITVEVDGRQVQGLCPDEKTIALMLQRCLEVRDFASMQQLVNFHIANLLEGGRERGREGEGEGEGGKGEGNSAALSDNPPPKPSPGKLQKSQRNLNKAEQNRQRRLMAKAARGIADPDSDAPLEPPPGFRMHRNDSLLARLALLTAPTAPTPGEQDASAASARSPTVPVNDSGPECAAPRVLMLHEGGGSIAAALREAAEGDGGKLGRVVVIVGDALGFTSLEEEELEAIPSLRKVSLGSQPLLASHCIVLAHHYLDMQKEEEDVERGAQAPSSGAVG